LVDRILAVLPRLEGQYAVVAVHRAEPGVVVAFRDGPPLVVGLGQDENLVASDVTALLHRTRKVIYLENGEVAEIRQDGICLRDREGDEIERTADILDWDAARVEKGGYRHFMLKEIYEQPDAIRNTVSAYLDQERVSASISMASALHPTSWRGSSVCTWWRAGPPGTRAWQASSSSRS
jgi:glucosamine--fructose-6-phosphate aminotransferase (isomerizing)